jgi:carbon-monoxide dehydrogenase medium subunit
MIPAQFNYEAPRTLEEALALLAQNGDDAKILAGGHSLIPAMKLRLAQPRVVIDISRIRDLGYIRDAGSQLQIGAMTTHYEIESSKLLKQYCPLLPECASHIGDAQVRNKGTIGGSLAHADPAADWPAAIIAVKAELVVVGPTGERTISSDAFIVDLLTTSLLPGEILREIRIEKPQGRFGHSYQKVRHPASGFAVVGIAVDLRLNDDQSCSSVSMGVTGVSSRAFRATGVEAELAGKQIKSETVKAAAARVCENVDANADLYASEDYRKHLATVYARRAIEAACEKIPV